MYKLPADVETELQKKFPNVHIPTLVQYIIHSIFEKSLIDGSCSIRGFGKFISFKTTSGRSGRDVIRFKFKISNTLNNKLKTDQYLLDNIPIKASNLFTSDHEKKTENKKSQQNANTKALKEAEKLGREKTRNKLVTNEVISIMDKIVNKELET